mgnify:CR=1 FL=1
MPVTFTPMRAAISRRMVESKSKAPHFYVSTDIEMEAVTAANTTLNEGKSGDDRVTITAWLVRALAQSLAAAPALNAVWSGETLERVDQINIGIAIAIRIEEGRAGPHGFGQELLASGSRKMTKLEPCHCADLGEGCFW